MRILMLLVFIVFISCNEGKQTETSVSKADTPVVDSIAKEPIKPTIHKLYDNVARHIAGIPIDNECGLDTALNNKKYWKEYSETIEKNWHKIDSTKINKMKEWSKNELNGQTSTTVFYPFSGADFMNVFTFFPEKENYILVGLEPEGSLPEFYTGGRSDSVAQYFNKIKKSLHAILNFSFFRTKSMSTDFKNEDLNGTVHLLLFFIKRTGNAIVDIKPISLNEDGNIEVHQSFEEKQKSTNKNKGIEIQFTNASNQLKRVYYFSVNLDNTHLEKNTTFTNYINKHKDATTYLKSASYLMHKDYFSTIRTLLLNNSKYLLEDDSGIPYKYFNDSIWVATLYGKYNGAISLFPNSLQNDLKQAYTDSLVTIKPLPFGIGYKYHVGESNLMYFIKK